MKRTIKMLSVLTVMTLILLTALPALAGTLTVNYLQDDSKPKTEQFNFREERIELAAYLIGEGAGTSWEFLDNYKDIEILDTKGKFRRACIDEIKAVINAKDIRPNATAWTKAVGDNDGVAFINVVSDGMYLVVQNGSQTKGTVRTSGMMVATADPLDETNAKWEYTPPEEEIPEERPYTLTIYYIYWDGSTAFPTHTEIELWPGYKYEVPSPQNPGYTVSIEVVKGVMPAHDMVYTVVYYPREDGKKTIPLEDYETPLGLGDIQMHVGVCFE